MRGVYQRIMVTEAEVFDGWEETEWIEEAGGYDDTDFHSLVKTMAERLHNLDERFDFDFVGVLEDAVDGAFVQLYLGESIWLSHYVETKHLTDDRSVAGRAGAMAIVSALLYEHNQLLEFAAKKGLEPRSI